jgi:hypothetical protein
MAASGFPDARWDDSEMKRAIFEPEGRLYLTTGSLNAEFSGYVDHFQRGFRELEVDLPRNQRLR